MSRELRQRLESLQGELVTLKERLAELKPRLAEREREAAALEARCAEVAGALEEVRAQNRALEKATRRLTDHLPTAEGQRSAERAAAMVLMVAFGGVVLFVLLMRFF